MPQKYLYTHLFQQWFTESIFYNALYHAFGNTKFNKTRSHFKRAQSTYTHRKISGQNLCDKEYGVLTE